MTAPELRKALHRAKVTGATLVIAKLDRLSRNLRFIAELQEGKVKFVCADMPDANELAVHILRIASSARAQGHLERTKRAPQAAKARVRCSAILTVTPTARWQGQYGGCGRGHRQGRASRPGRSPNH